MLEPEFVLCAWPGKPWHLWHLAIAIFPQCAGSTCYTLRWLEIILLSCYNKIISLNILRRRIGGGHAFTRTSCISLIFNLILKNIVYPHLEALVRTCDLILIWELNVKPGISVFQGSHNEAWDYSTCSWVFPNASPTDVQVTGHLLIMLSVFLSSVHMYPWGILFSSRLWTYPYVHI